MATLIICEKRTAGEELGSDLGGSFKKQSGFMESSQYTITWAMGHLFRNETPEEVDPSYALFNRLHKPEMYRQEKLARAKFVPDITAPKYKPTAEQKNLAKAKKANYETILKLLKKPWDEIILAADADAEGERIHGDIIRYNNHLVGKVGKITRFFNTGSYKSPDAVAKAMKERENFKAPRYENLYQSAVARSMADYLVGMKLTKALSERHMGFYTVGRVQTAVLGMIARREAEIKNFKPKPFWHLHATLGEERLDHFYYDEGTDDEGKPTKVQATNYYDEESVNHVEKELKDKELKGEIVSFEKKKTSSKKPLLYNTGDFEVEAMRVFKISLKEADEILEYLRDEGFTTYPRTDGNYFSKLELGDVKEAAKTASTYFGVSVGAVDTKNPLFNDAKALKQNHTPLVPTGKIPTTNDKERWKKSKVKFALEGYEMIARRLLIQFMPDDEIETQKLLVKVGDHLFKANAERVISQGWRTFAKAEKKSSSLKDYKSGEKVQLKDLEKIEGMTTVPPHYTETSLLQAMINVSKALEEELNEIDDPTLKKEKTKEYKNIKKVLSSVHGIGTQATRKTILDNLLSRGYIKTKPKVNLTVAGEFIVTHLPPYLTSLATTAEWEQALDEIRQGNKSTDAFINSLDNLLMDEIIPTIFEQPVRKGGKLMPTGKQLKFAESIAKRLGIELPSGVKEDNRELSQWIDAYKDADTANRAWRLSDKQIAVIEKNGDDEIKALIRGSLDKAQYQKAKEWLDNYFAKVKK